MRGIAVELIVLLVLQTLGTSIFARFEIETPKSKTLLRPISIHPLVKLAQCASIQVILDGLG